MLTRLFLFLALVIVASGFAEKRVSENWIDAFSLPFRSDNAVFDLANHEGIVVLDFFAFWCIPCLATSTDIEKNVTRHYDRRGGNLHGLPVKVVSINVERSRPERTDAFIEKAGLKQVLEDEGGELLEKLGGEALPYIVILKSDGNFENRSWETVYKKSGYDGSDSILAIVDSLKDPSNARFVQNEEHLPVNSVKDEDQPGNRKEAETEIIEDVSIVDSEESVGEVSDEASFAYIDERVRGMPIRSRSRSDYEVNIDFLDSSDITLATGGIRGSGRSRIGEWDLGLSLGRIEIDYEPFPEADIIGVPQILEEGNVSVQASTTFAYTDLLELDLSGGAYRGFTDHRSIWLDEYYRQQFSGIDGYVEADPWGYNLSTGASWDTRTAAGIVGATLAFQQDDVAPGYDRPIFQPLERGRERLYTGLLLLEQESIVSKRVRIRHQLQFTKTTDREMRYRYGGYVHFALAENWVIRAEGAATFESVVAEGEEDFESYSAGIVAEYDWDETWFLGFNARRYEDTGQIETSILVSAGPPPLVTDHIGLMLRYQGERTAFRFSLASYQTRFDEVDSPIRPFGNLYTDRDWILASASLNRPF